MRVADLRPLRHRDTRWVIAGATAWGVLDITIGLFGALYLLRAGGGLRSAALWLLPLGAALALVFLAGRPVFARIGTRPFRLASPLGAIGVAIAFAALGARAAEPAITILLSAVWATAQGLHWSAFNLVEFRRVPAADRAPYFALLSRLGVVIAAVVPLAAGFFVSQFADLTGYRSLFALVALVGGLVFLAAWHTPTHRTAPERGRLGHALATPAGRWATLGVGFRGLWDLGGMRIMLPLLLLGLVGGESGYGVFQAANAIAIFIGYTLSTRLLARMPIPQALRFGMLGMLLANLLFVAIPHVAVLFVFVPLSGIATAIWGNASFVANQSLIDRTVGDDAYTFIVVRELALSVTRTLAAAVAIVAAVVFGDAAARPLMAAYMLAPIAGWYCTQRALREAATIPVVLVT